MLESYSLARLDERSSSAVEEHLLLCEPCQRRLTEFDSFVRATQAAARELQLEAAQRKAAKGASWLMPGWEWRLPGFAMAGSLAGLLFLAAPMLRQTAILEPQLVQLAATRSASQPGAAVAAGKPVTLALDVTGLELAGAVRVEVADAAGLPVASGGAEVREDRVQYTLRKGLERGNFWVRIYRSSGALASEMGLQVR
jgi:hypothetical protein